MARRIAIVLLAVLVVLVFLLNASLLFSVADGAHVVREAEVAAGHPLDCFELYDARSIDNYFYPDRAWQGEIIYVSSILFPLWLGATVVVPLALTFVLGRQKRWHWLPPILISPLVLALVFYLRMIGKIVCAIE